MSLGYLTFNQICVQGSQLGGNPGLLVQPPGANYTESILYTYLRLVLHHLFIAKDWPQLLTEVAVNTGTGTGERGIATMAVSLGGLANQYRAIKAVKLDTVQNALQQFQLFDQLWAKVNADIDNNVSSTVPTGIPASFAVKPDKTELWVYPIPNQVYTARILYYQLPNVANYIATSVPDFEDSWALVNAVAFYVRNYDKDTLVALSKQAADEILGQYRTGQEDTGRNRPMQVSVDPFRWSFMPGD